MNPFYHSQVRLPPYRARYLQRFHPYPRSPSSRLPGWARAPDDSDFDFEWVEFLEVLLSIHNVNDGTGTKFFWRTCASLTAYTY